MPTRDAIHALVDTAPDAVLTQIEAYLRALSDDDASGVEPNDAPLDDEPLTASELAMLLELEAAVVAGLPAYSMAEVRTMVDRLIAANGRGAGQRDRMRA